MATHYQSSSKGAVEIASMRYEHALNARDKLQREQPHGRAAEIEALSKRISEIEATFEESAK